MATSFLQAPAQTASANPLSAGSLNLNKGGSMGSLMSMGTKAASPGGINTASSNTIKSSYTAPSSQQTATSYTNPNTSFQNNVGSVGTMLQTPSSKPQSPYLSQIAAPFVGAAKAVGNFLTSPPMGGTASQASNSPLSKGTLNLSNSATATPATGGTMGATMAQSQLQSGTPSGSNQNLPTTNPNAALQVPYSLGVSPLGTPTPPQSYNAQQQSPSNQNVVTPPPASPSNTTGGSLGVGTPTQIASNTSPMGMVQNEIGQSQNLYQQNYAAIQPTISANQQIIAQATQEEEQLTGGSYSGTAADYSGRVAQLENIKQAAQGNINSAVANLNNSINSTQNAFNTGVGATTNLVSSPYGQPLINPATGQSYAGGAPTGQGGGAQPGSAIYNAMQTYAQGLANNSIPYNQIPSEITGNSVLNAQLLQMAGHGGGSSNASGGFNLNANIATSAGQQSALSQIPNWQGALTAASGTAQQIQQYLQANPTLNPSPANIGNQFLQYIQGGQLSDPRYQTLMDSLNEYTNTIASVLGVGGDTTNLKTQIAQSFIDPSAQNQSIQQVLSNITNGLGAAKIGNYQSGVLGGGVVQTPSLNQSSTNASGNPFDPSSFNLQ